MKEKNHYLMTTKPSKENQKNLILLKKVHGFILTKKMRKFFDYDPK